VQGPQGPNRPTVTSSAVEVVPEDDLAAVLETARRAFVRTDGWIIDDANYNRLRDDCEVLGLRDEMAIGVAVRTASRELCVSALRKRQDLSYSGVVQDQVLYEAKWKSFALGRWMYLKFGISEDTV
jgi:hypothetical protein